MKRILITVAAFFAFAAVLSAEHPNDAHGFAADHVYSVHDVDTVNAFNGNMIIRIPIGPEYKVNGLLSYQLSLTYNSHLWHFVDDTSSYDLGDNIVATPLKFDNAGLGWRLSLGKLYAAGDPDIDNDPNTWVYQSGDGADHRFYDLMSEPKYTRDSTYLRLSSIDTTTRYVEFPDGAVHTFRQLMRAPNGTWQTSETSAEWFLSTISDASGNKVSIAYSSAYATQTTPLYKEIWTITDSARITTAYFRDGLTTDFNATLDHVDMQVFGGAQLSYSFATQLLNVQTPPGDTSGRSFISVPVLTAVTPTLGNGYSMMLDEAPAYDNTSHNTPGLLERLVLPTLGAVGWTYNLIPFGGITSHRTPAIEKPTGVESRTTYDANGLALGTWNYDRHLSRAEFCQVYICSGTAPPPCNSGRSRQMTVYITDPPTSDGTQKTTINYFSNYEYIDDPDGETCPASGWVHAEHGLPFTRYAPQNPQNPQIPRFLSSEVRTGFSAASLPANWDGRGQVPDSGTRLRETYVSYRLDVDLTNQGLFDQNAGLSSTATTYLDDPNCPAPTPCSSATNYLGYDNFGHFKQTSTEGNLPGTGNFRTTFTNYNAAPIPSTPWLLTPYTEQCTIDEIVTVPRTLPVSSCSDLTGAFTSATQFDSSGRLTARRTLLRTDATTDPTDLLATFTYDGHGNVLSEQYYGGDTQPLNGGSEFVPPTSPTYTISHALTYSQFGGALTGDKATYGNGVVASDETYDQWTGAVAEVRDVAGLKTDYIYDLLGRVTNVYPPGVAGTAYTYPPAIIAGSVFTPAKVTALTDASHYGIGTISKEYQYDAFGRLWRQKSLLPDDNWSITQTDFDVLGRKMAVSQPEELTGPETSFVPTHKTNFSSYDAFGRAGSIQTPDGSMSTLAFTGVRSIVRSVNVATSATGTTPATTEEIHDAVGRLVQLTELSGATSATSPVGSLTTTAYTYDSTDHLRSVTTPGLAQQRSFTYDHRGFLTLEQHPEVGQSGNGSVSYVYSSSSGAVMGYDARGHATGKLTGVVNQALDLRFVYDQSERLITVYDSGDSQRLLKQYSFLSANGGESPYGQGKLSQAIRHNYPPGLTSDIAVTETYKYGSPSGRPSERDTLIENVAGIATLQSFSQIFTYDQLGATAQIDYPVCLSTFSCSGSALGSQPFAHRNGFLTGVSSYAPAITYNPDGTVFEVTHNSAGTVKDTYTPDSSGMSRPGLISFSGVSTCTVSAAVSGDATINSGQPATISAVLSGGSHPPSVAAPWTVTWFDGVNSVQDSATQSPWTKTFYPTATTQYTITSVTDGSCVGSSSGMATVTVQSCNASASVTGTGTTITIGQSALIQATLTAGTLPWNITWSDGFPQTNNNASTVQRTVQPTITTQYTITSMTDSTGCVGSHPGSETITVNSLNAPTGLVATTAANTASVTINWNSVSGATWYQVERATGFLLQDWQAIGGKVNSPSSTDYFGSITPTTYLYRVRSGITISNSDYLSAPSNIDYATVATTLFSDERLVAGATGIKGIHIGELRQAIDAVRKAAGFTTPVWSSYAAATGPILASDIITARQKLDEAVNILLGHGVAYTGEVPATNGKIWAYQLQQIRDGVR